MAMAERKPISTAPMDGSKITVHWTDEDGQENETIAQYRSLDRLRQSGGEWDAADEGWWAFVDGETQRKVHPDSWVPESEGEDG
jgi:hypothetical protein